MKYLMERIRSPKRLFSQSKTRLAMLLAGLAIGMVGLPVIAAEITVEGIDAVVQGQVYAHVVVDEPVDQVQMSIAGVVNRIERIAPYALMGDRGGELNALDTTALANGAYLLSVEVKLKDGRELSKYFPFSIDNPLPKAETAELSIAIGQVPSQVYVGQTFTIPTTGLADGEIVWFHLFDKEWGDLVRSNLVVKGDSLTFTIPDATGTRRLQLQYKGNYKKTRLIEVLPAITMPVPDVSPEPQPATEPVTAPEETGSVSISFDMASIPSSLIVGQRVSVPVTGIAEGEDVYYHMFDSQWGDLVRSNVQVNGGKVDLLIPNVSGDRILQLQYLSEHKAKKSVTVGSSDIVPAPAPQPEPVVVEPEPLPQVPTETTEPTEPGSAPAAPQEPEVVELEPTPQPSPEIKPTPDDDYDPTTAPRLVPGSGWSGATAVPGQIGNRHETVIAHWNVVPEQSVEDGFTVGVIAHHLDGIDRVEISANNGPWVRITEPSVNPRTKCEEYWAALDLQGQYGEVELRAIAYPTRGKPVLVEPIGSEYSKQDLTLYSYKVGAVLELSAGEHNLKAQNLPEIGWLVVRPKPGVSRSDVVLVGESRDWARGRLKLEGLTIKLPWGGAGLMGRYNVVDNSQIGNHIWLDGCRIIGAPLGDENEEDTWWIAHQWETATYTNCEISHVSKVFFSHRRIKTLARNCYIHDIYEDVFNAGGLQVNITIEDLDRTPLVKAQNLSKENWPHPDLWQYKTFSNSIVQDVTAVKNINAQGLFIQGSRVENVAVVRAKLETTDPWRVFHPQVPITNWLIKDSNLKGGSSFSRASVAEGERFIVQDSSFGSTAPYLFTGWDSPGVYVLPQPPLYD